MRLIFLNRFFHPDHSATSQMLSDLAFALACEPEASVVVITSRQRYDAPMDTLPARETVGGVAIHRVWTSRFGRRNLIGRSIDYVTFYASALCRLWSLARRGDVVIAKTDPPMLSVIAAPVCWGRHIQLVNWLQDIFPETAEALGIGGRAARGPLRLLRRLRGHSLCIAAMNVVLGQRMAEHVARLGVSAARIRILPNWADGTSIAPIPPAGNALRREWGLGDAFVVGYSGNLGRAHEIGTMLAAMTQLEQEETGTAAPDRRPVRWLFVGSGALLDELKAEAARRGLTSVRFAPYQPKERLAESLSAADVHLVSLRPELEGLVVPSKIYGIAAAGRPTVFIGDEDGEIARLIAHFKCGLTVAAGDGEGLARTLRDLADNPDACCWMGERARQAFDAELDKPIAVARWRELLAEVADGEPRGRRVH
ncbi:MAG TPA: glycosyltransferase family 4 protein [Hyphomicrobiaceae bacterium]|nr:glycosyltransferase family 4 protein [Hyphomicrobiaceae bacterium]